MYVFCNTWHSTIFGMGPLLYVNKDILSHYWQCLINLIPVRGNNINVYNLITQSPVYPVLWYIIIINPVLWYVNILLLSNQSSNILTLDMYSTYKFIWYLYCTYDQFIMHFLDETPNEILISICMYEYVFSS